MKAPAGLDPNQPPTTGWQFSKEVIIWEGADFQIFRNKFKDGEFEDDPSVLCTNQREEPCCKITVSLSKEVGHSFSAGVYERTNLLSMGREVVTVSQPSFVNLFAGV